MLLSKYIEELQSILSVNEDMQVVNSFVREFTGTGYLDYLGKPEVEVVDGEWFEFESENLVTDNKVLVLSYNLI